MTLLHLDLGLRFVVPNTHPHVIPPTSHEAIRGQVEGDRCDSMVEARLLKELTRGATRQEIGSGSSCDGNCAGVRCIGGA